jgi:hypothetical protein
MIKLLKSFQTLTSEGKNSLRRHLGHSGWYHINSGRRPRKNYYFLFNTVQYMLLLFFFIYKYVYSERQKYGINSLKIKHFFLIFGSVNFSL